MKNKVKDMKYTGFINKEDDVLEVYINPDNNLYLCIRHENNNGVEYIVKVETEDIATLIKTLQEAREYLDNQSETQE
jgi:hypothetical protein|nr:MAG TPA: hypothetical protein [Caudoviricetes sp.]